MGGNCICVNASKHMCKDWVSLKSQNANQLWISLRLSWELLALEFTKHCLHHTGSHVCIYVAFPLRVMFYAMSQNSDFNIILFIRGTWIC